MNLSESQAVNGKAVRLVDYLLRLAQLRTKPIRDISECEKVLWLSSVPRERGCFIQAWGRDEEHASDEWLEVQNRREPEFPTIPSECKHWTSPLTVRNKGELPELLTEITRLVSNPDWCEGSDQPEAIQLTERLEDQPETLRVWERFLEDRWLPWTEEHNVWEKVHKVYSALFAIHQAQLRLGEEYELVLGVGLLTWQTPTRQRIRRHLVVADATLEFEARLGRFTIHPHIDGAKLRPELDMLDIEDQPAGAERIAKASLAAGEDDPWEIPCVEGVLQTLVHTISSHGHYDDTLEAKNAGASTNPVVEYAPALILRKRSSKGLVEALERIREQIENGEQDLGEFADLAEVRSADGRDLPIATEEAAVPFEGEIFFPKPSNDEQRQIASKIRAASGVLVQGPPGTGKSHTIANLICHLLATGQRTLITAKTPRALQVLEGLVPRELRPLCISLLGSGREEHRSLESSVGGILRKNEEWNENRAQRKREDLAERLRSLREEKVKLNRQLFEVRESETHSLSIAGGAYRGTAARISEAVRRDQADFEWFTDSIPLEQDCPISGNDLQSVLMAMRRFTLGDRRELTRIWPKSLPTSERFAEIVGAETSATKEEQDSTRGADERLASLLKEIDPHVIEDLQDALSRYRATRGSLLKAPHPWVGDALRDILAGDSILWHELSRVTKEIVASIEDLAGTADRTEIDLPGAIEARSLHEQARKLKAHLTSGGKLGWAVFRPKWVKESLHVLKTVRLFGRPCSTIEDFSVLMDATHVRIECERAWGFWKGRSERVEGPYALQLAAFKSLLDTLEKVLASEKVIVKCREAIRRCSSIDESKWSEEAEVDKVVSSCRLALSQIRKQRAIEAIQSVEAPISRMVRKDIHPVTNDLLSAIRCRDVNKFALCANTIQELDIQHSLLQKADKHLAELRTLLPQLAISLQQSCGELYWEDRLLHIGEAWNWARAKGWLERYIRKDDVPAIIKRTKQIEDEINDAVTLLASLHAWSFCFSRLKESHRRHMQAWQLSMRSLGKGTGKHAPRHRRQAQTHLNNCREAIPAWVMPLHRIWDTVSPAPGMFDVIIVDEASQCGAEALPLFYFGKKILIVGDDKQISPDAVGLPRDSVHRLMEEYLSDFLFKSSFDVENSLFDHGKLRYGTQRITLREHFRCMPEIIRFSNDLCYADTPLIPLRQHGASRLPPLEHVFVNGGYREGSNNRTINRLEAEAIVKRIISMCGDSRYDGKTMGVVVLQGEAQAGLIESRLLDQLGAEEMAQRRLVCGNPYSFQGDERDIMFLSLVAATNERIGPLTKVADERRFNVASSRARDMMILFHSVNLDDLSTTCLRRRLLEFFEGTKPQQIAGIEVDILERRAAQDNRHIVKPPSPFDSWFEVDVALELLRRKFTVLAQHECAGKRIDLVIEGGQARLAVECDGDNWHGPDRFEEDMQRQRQLERCGWEFFRVRESAFYADRDASLQLLWPMLEERGILRG
ncbi:MAG: AAA family ATPase [Bryobacterales bacterium]|nr:AAA family ATPase [Bryobacterales bacterium]